MQIQIGVKNKLHEDMKKYGIDKFHLEILGWFENFDEMEKLFIERYNTLEPNGYNIQTGGREPPVHYGEKHHNCHVNDECLKRIIEELKLGKLTEPEIGNLFDPPISQPTINSINHGLTHRIDGIDYPIRKECPYWVSEKEFEDIIWLLKETCVPVDDIAKHYGKSKSTIVAINVGRNKFVESINYPIRKHRGKKCAQPVETILANRSTLAIDTQVEMGICD